jgi:hypothetical protein
MSAISSSWDGPAAGLANTGGGWGKGMKDNEFNFTTFTTGLSCSIAYLERRFDLEYGFWLLHQCAGEWVNDAPAF